MTDRMHLQQPRRKTARLNPCAQD